MSGKRTSKILVGTPSLFMATIAILVILAAHAQTANPSTKEYQSGSCSPTNLKQVEQDAANGSASAQKQLGDFYDQGRCVAQNYAKAASWYRRSAEQGNADAQYDLGKFLLEGKEVQRDPGAAADWFRHAAEQMHHGAQYALGSLYLQGRGVPKDKVKGYEWVRISSPRLDTHTRDILATLAKSMTQAEVDDAEAQAQAWIAAHGGNEN